jgi:Thioredoxin-like
VKILAFLILQTLVHTTEPGSAPPPQASIVHPERRAYSADRDAKADVDAALSRARQSGKTVAIIMGANWCHDSVGLAGWLDTPRFTDMMRDRFDIVYVDVGTPQIGKGRNLDIAKRVGVRKVKGTPLVLLVSADGILLNSKEDAASWRNAASRSEDDIYRYFAEFKPATR